jgi:hypothetical protein
VTRLDRSHLSGSVPPALSDERKQLVLRYMTDPVEQDVEDVPSAETLEPASRAGEVSASARNGKVLRQPPSEPATEVERPRRGRPPGRKTRRQVHFHVDPEEDRLLLAAAGRFGSQQKGLIAALKALEEVADLREQARLLEAECARQRQLLVEAEAVFNKSRVGG